MARVTARHLPSTPTPCARTSCVYNEAGVCDDPYINKGNGDAACHRMNNRDLLRELLGDEAVKRALR